MESYKKSRNKAIACTIMAILLLALGLVNLCVGCSNINKGRSSDSESVNNPPKSASSTSYSTTTNNSYFSSTPDSASENDEYIFTYTNEETRSTTEYNEPIDTYEQPYTEDVSYDPTNAADMIWQPVSTAINMFGDGYSEEVLDDGEFVLIYGDYDLLVWYNSDQRITGLRLTRNNPYLNAVNSYDLTSNMSTNELYVYGVLCEGDDDYYVYFTDPNDNEIFVRYYYSFSSDSWDTICDFVEVTLDY